MAKKTVAGVAGRWQIVRDLGAGGQSKVHLVEDTTGEYANPVALKKIASGASRRVYERFHREIEALASIDHPGVVRVLAHSAPDDGDQYYVMEHVEGACSLQKLIDRGESMFHQDALATIELAISLLDALAACHGENVLHRDLSPGNILVLPDRSTRIIDFGLCQIDDQRDVTRLDEGLGTQNYMAPECEAHARAPITERADIYSVGKICWSAITGKRAFAREAPVFQDLSMPKLFVDDRMTWHLHHLFEWTVRHDQNDRWDLAMTGLRACRVVRQLIVSNALPVERIVAGDCPRCRLGVLRAFDYAHQVFVQPLPGRTRGFQCNTCGVIEAIDFQVPKGELDRRKNLS